MESGQARPQGDRLHADLRAARTHPRRRHAAARHRRRRRPARSHPRRRLLPELYLPHSALDHRARRLRPHRFRRRHAVPVDLRRDPQSVRHVEDDVPACLFALFRRAAELPRRDRRQFLRQRDGRAAPRSRRAARQADHRRRTAPFDRGLQRKPPAGARSLCLPGGEAVAGARRGSLSDDARRAGAAGRGAYRHAARLSRRGARRGAADARQLPHRAHRHVLRAAAAQSDQVARTCPAATWSTTISCWSPAGSPATSRSRAIRCAIFRMPSCITPNRRRPNTSPTRRKRASTWSARSSAPMPKA